jgi:hypothetical protein
MVMTTKRAKLQIVKFRETARKLECDEDEEAFNRALTKIARAPTAKDPKPRDQRKQ